MTNLKSFAIFACLLSLFGAGFSAASLVVVNSQSWEDVMAGSVYASANGYSFAFILTPSHGKYIADFILGTKEGSVMYFEGASPVYSELGANLAPLGSRLSSVKNSGLAAYFASKAPKDSAIIVGRDIGAEALSIAPYAALTNGALLFTDAAGADAAFTSAKTDYKSVMVYGSIASSMKSTSGAKVIASGSVYSDNLQAVQMFFNRKGSSASKQVLLLSGFALEKSMVGKEVPVMLVDRSGPSDAAISMLKSLGVKTAVVFQGDADITDSLATIKEKTGMGVFAKLGEGFPKDAQMRDLAVAVLPGQMSSQLVVVNSKSWEDAIAGAVYASANGYSYLFVLTPSHGSYLANYLSGMGQSKILYFEGATPVYPEFAAKLAPLGSRAVAVKNSGLAAYFASKAPKDSAIIVGRDIGAEALSIAPYAALTNGALLFTSQSLADSTFTAAKSNYKSVLVYGSIAPSIKSTAGATVINSGSVYSDNVQAAKMAYDRLGASSLKQAALVSGRAFEKSMVSTAYPIVLLGQTEVSSEAKRLLSDKAKNGIVFQGDSDIVDAVAAAKSSTGISVFAKLGEGYTGDAQVKDLAVMPLPYRAVDLELSGLSYDFGKKAFVIDVKNKGTSPAYVRVSATLPSGRSGTSELSTVGAKMTNSVAVPLNADSAIGGSMVGAATVSVLYGADMVVPESSSTVQYTSIRVIGKTPPAPSSAAPPAASGAAPPSPSQVPPAGQGGISPLLIVAAVLIIGAGAYFLMGGKRNK